MGQGPGGQLRHAAALSFGLGSIALMADMAAVVLRNGERGGNIFEMGFPTLIGLIGLCLWVLAVILFISLKVGRREKRSTRSHPVFLRGKDGFTCRACKRFNKVVTRDYFKHHRCVCGAEYDLFQDGPWDGQDPMGRNAAGRGGSKRIGTGRARSAPSRQRAH